MDDVGDQVNNQPFDEAFDVEDPEDIASTVGNSPDQRAEIDTMDDSGPADDDYSRGDSPPMSGAEQDDGDFGDDAYGDEETDADRIARQQKFRLEREAKGEQLQSLLAQMPATTQPPPGAPAPSAPLVASNRHASLLLLAMPQAPGHQATFPR